MVGNRKLALGRKVALSDKWQPASIPGEVEIREMLTSSAFHAPHKPAFCEEGTIPMTQE
jgi:hypothetical protein